MSVTEHILHALIEMGYSPGDDDPTGIDFADIGMDASDRVCLFDAVESHYAVKLSDEQIETISSVSHLAAAIETLLKTKRHEGGARVVKPGKTS
jgi:acyl carrier protein